MPTIEMATIKEWKELLGKGYQNSMIGNKEAAADVWGKLWERVLEETEKGNYPSIEKVAKAATMEIPLFNWPIDYIDVLHRAEPRETYTRQIISFGEKWISLTEEKNSENTLVIKREIAEAHFRLGEVETGDQLFQQYTKEHPTSGYGWINWSDQYGIFATKETQDHDKAIHILLQGLQVENLEDKRDAWERLEELYHEQGKEPEAAAIRKLINKESTNSFRTFSDFEPLLVNKQNQPETIKVGRNDPCTCGSGKKYKKCCG